MHMCVLFEVSNSNILWVVDKNVTKREKIWPPNTVKLLCAHPQFMDVKFEVHNKNTRTCMY